MNRIGFLLFSSTVCLSLIGIFILFETSTYAALIQIGDKYYFLKNQLLWVVLGILSALVVYKFNHKTFYNLSLPSLIFSIILLLLVFIPGIGIELKGAHRWINMKFFIFQPAELLKITLSLYLAAWLSNFEKKRLFAFLLLFLLCIALVAAQPDMGTAFIIAASSIIVYFLSGAKIREMIFILFLVVGASAILIFLAPYRLERFTSFTRFNPSDINSASYHIKQILIALGSSGLTGVGIGNSISKYGYLPEATTDSIFTIFAEETGFVGSVFLISLIALQLFLGFLVAIKTKDRFGRLLACGIITFLGIQSLINLSSQAVLIPLTGVPLPFISYGGSSMLINYLSMGILLSISKNIS